MSERANAYAFKKRSLKVIRRVADIQELPREDVEKLQPVSEKFEFRVSEYYAKLIDWKNPDDPLRRIILPQVDELESDLDFDASHERDNTVVHGLQHKYSTTALLLVNDVCAAYCRFCFRKRFTLSTSKESHIFPSHQQNRYEKETAFDVQEGLEYIIQHPEINNVLLTGGDPLMLSITRLEPILQSLREIPHIKTIRIGSKVPAFDPERLNDRMLDMLASYSTPRQRIYLIVHFNHQRELTAVARERIDAMLRRGLILCNQTPLLKGVNNNVDELVALFSQLAESGVAPYYLFQCRPIRGNDRYQLSLQEGLHLVNATRARLNGLAKRFRYVGSHATGKIEIIGQMGDSLILRYHEAKYFADEDRLLAWPFHQSVYWFDDILRENPTSLSRL
ncbi:MAG TPA: KamA family radical SAM protein [Ktedonobacteraceae bacterium]|nr:KamA family radical SAM protein [Ktedonobacteraceae bacterium]